MELVEFLERPAGRACRRQKPRSIQLNQWIRGRTEREVIVIGASRGERMHNPRYVLQGFRGKQRYLRDAVYL